MLETSGKSDILGRPEASGEPAILGREVKLPTPGIDGKLPIPGREGRLFKPGRAPMRGSDPDSVSRLKMLGIGKLEVRDRTPERPGMPPWNGMALRSAMLS